MKGVGLGVVFLSFIDADVLNCCTSGHDDEVPELVERVEDVSAILVQMSDRMSTSTTDDRVVYENTKEVVSGLFIMKRKS